MTNQEEKIISLVLAAKNLLSALPACDLHKGTPATKAHGRGAGRFCDACGNGVPDYPRAAPIRAMQALLETLEKGQQGQ